MPVFFLTMITEQLQLFCDLLGSGAEEHPLKHRRFRSADNDEIVPPGLFGDQHNGVSVLLYLHAVPFSALKLGGIFTDMGKGYRWPDRTVSNAALPRWKKWLCYQKAIRR
jgi:hypothetical protein